MVSEPVFTLPTMPPTPAVLPVLVDKTLPVNAQFSIFVPVCVLPTIPPTLAEVLEIVPSTFKFRIVAPFTNPNSPLDPLNPLIVCPFPSNVPAKASAGKATLLIGSHSSVNVISAVSFAQRLFSPLLTLVRKSFNSSSLLISIGTSTASVPAAHAVVGSRPSASTSCAKPTHRPPHWPAPCARSCWPAI